MNEPTALTMDINGILKQLPHRYPFLLVDRVVECVPGKRITALKNVTINEPFFPGHFPHRPVMPGVMILEAMAQAAGILAFRTADVIPDEQTALLLRRHRRGALPQAGRAGRPAGAEGDVPAAMRGIWKFATVAEVDGHEVCSAEMMVAPDTKG